MKPKSCLTLSFKAYVRGEGTKVTDFETGYVMRLSGLNFSLMFEVWLDKSSSVHDMAQELCYSFIANTFQSLLVF